MRFKVQDNRVFQLIGDSADDYAELVKLRKELEKQDCLFGLATHKHDGVEDVVCVSVSLICNEMLKLWAKVVKDLALKK